MKLTSRKRNRKIKFGMFKSEKVAQEYLSHVTEHRFNDGLLDTAKFFVVKREVLKAGKNAFEAYALIPR